MLIYCAWVCSGLRDQKKNICLIQECSQRSSIYALFLQNQRRTIRIPSHEKQMSQPITASLGHDMSDLRPIFNDLHERNHDLHIVPASIIWRCDLYESVHLLALSPPSIFIYYPIHSQHVFPIKQTLQFSVKVTFPPIQTHQASLHILSNLNNQHALQHPPHPVHSDSSEQQRRSSTPPRRPQWP